MAKEKVKNKRVSQIWKMYKLQGEKLIKRQTCPKCGPGMFLAEHKDRFYCGNCHFVQMKG